MTTNTGTGTAGSSSTATTGGTALTGASGGAAGAAGAGDGDKNTSTAAASTGGTTSTAAGSDGKGTAAVEDKGTEGAGDAGAAGKGAEGELELKLPEGVKVDEALMGEFKPLLKELGLKSEGAQKLVDLFLKGQAAQLERFQADIEREKSGWADALKADKEIGGSAYDGSLAHARRAMEKFGSPELKQFLLDTGLGDFPPLVRAFVQMGKALGEDSVAGANGAGKGAAAASDDALLRQLYDHPSSASLFPTKE